MNLFDSANSVLGSSQVRGTGEPAYQESSNGSASKAKITAQADDSGLKLRTYPMKHESAQPCLISYESSDVDQEAGGHMMFDEA